MFEYPGKLIAISSMLLLLDASAQAANAVSLSDIPLFVTNALPPNVILSPAYLYDANEVSLKDIPWSRKFAVGLGGINNAQPWLSGAVFSRFSQPWRVTPWPNTEVSMNTFNANSYTATSNKSVYASDVQNGVQVPLNYYTFDFQPRSFGFVSQPYPQPNLLDQDINHQFDNQFISYFVYDEANARYLRSDSNFLYFNESVAGLNSGHGYQPWPALGGAAFPEYTDTTAARKPLYNPLGDITLIADLNDAAGTEYISYGFASGHAATQASNVARFHTYIGQYWKHTANTNVYTKGNYTGVCWDVQNNIGCNTQMSDDNKVNFANWFTYWRSSYLATRGILGELIDRLGPNNADVLDRFRFGIEKKDAAGTRTIDGLYSIDAAVGATKEDKKKDLMQKIGGVIYGNATNFQASWDPSVTETYFQDDAPYRDSPSNANSTVRSCRRNYEILITPDYTWLKDDSATQGGDGSATVATLINVGNADQNLGAPYADTLKNTLADVGAYGWKTDLRPNMEDSLLPVSRDEGTNQHIVRYIVGPSAAGLVYTNTNYGYNDAVTIMGNTDWENVNYLASLQRVYDDLWHMALNSRGWFYPSSDVATSVNNLLVAFNDILVRNVSGSSVATNTTSLQNNSKIYQATVESDWKGHLRAYPLTTDVATGITSVDYVNQAWDLAEQVSSQQQNSRAIYTSVAGDGKTFIWANLDNATKAIFTAQEPNGIAPAGIADNDVFGTKVVEYLRGSGDCEDGSGTACVSGVQYWFRRRNLVRNDTTAYSLSNPNGRNVLGDVSNSNPWYVSTPLLGMSDVDYPGYNAFRVAHNNRINVLYVGVNDGMLHAVRTDGVAASADTDALAGGSELFAYIPSFVLPVLPQLASTSYSHHFSADGSPFAANADIGGTWKTVLASGANKGGKGYFLLDITDPVSFSAASVLWEFTNANDADMNYTFNMPVPLPAGNSRAGDARQIVHMNDNSWDLIVGNGYPEDAGKSACLFIISLTGPGATGWELGTNYHKLCAGATSYTLGALSGGLATNGLSTPTPFDLNGDGKVDVVYAGDLNGNMWRFNVASSNPASWAVDYAGQPLFVAKNDAGQRQPIIAPPEVTSNTTPNPTAGKNSILVLFGTGKFIETTDQGNTDKQSFYAVWDREDSSFSNLDRSYLYEQKFDTTTSGDVSIRVPHDSAHPKVVVGYCLEADLTDCSSVKTENSNKMGWYWDMPDLYERMTGHASLSNNVVLFNTFIPGIDATGALDPCQYGGSGWIMGLDAVNGYMENYDVFDVNRDGVITAADVAAAGVKVGAAIGGTTFARSSSTSAIGIYSPMNLGTGASEGKKMTIAVNTGENVTGRVSWFEITD